jgi:4-amino-4-deoxy-L-arabinose transferase-like glycosyltransferase
MSAKKKRATDHNNIALLVFICLLCLIPFINKAFHMDDPLFIWAAKQIQTNPIDFYGFTVNWYGYEAPMSEITKNPPIASYYIALVAFLFGWSEIVIHLAFLIPPCMVVVGTYYLAKELCEQPFLATVAAMATPVFLVSSTTIMCDTMMLAFWVWAIYLWLRGIKTNSNLDLVGASFLIAACSLTKYFGMSLIPLLIVYTLVEKRKIGQWMLFMLIPILILAGYQWATQALYGKGLLFDAVSYSTSTRGILSGNFLTNILTGLAFTGGCIITILFYTPLMWRKWLLTITAACITILIFSLYQFTTLLNFTRPGTGPINWLFIAQLSFLCCAGVCCVSLMIMDFVRQKNAKSLLLILWTMGTFFFAVFLNWTINGRSLLPLVPASGILLVRQLSRQEGTDYQKRFARLLLPLAPALIITLLVTWADYRLANTTRDAAAKIYSTYKQMSDPVWFQGHWGFQYYMQKAGAKAVDFNKPNFKTGNILVIPINNANMKPPSRERFTLVQKAPFSTDSLFTTMSLYAGAGFYSDTWGPLPFAIRHEIGEEYYIFRLVK